MTKWLEYPSSRRLHRSPEYNQRKASEIMNDATYYRKNFILRAFEKLSEIMRGLPAAKVNAIAFAVIFFITLVAFLEYKVFESTYSLTGNIVLSVSRSEERRV